MHGRYPMWVSDHAKTPRVGGVKEGEALLTLDYGHDPSHLGGIGHAYNLRASLPLPHFVRLYPIL